MISSLILLLALPLTINCAPQPAQPRGEPESKYNVFATDASRSHGTDAQQYSSSQFYDWARGAVTEYTIHDSCNTSEVALLSQGLHEAEVLAAHARDHILRFGNSSSYFLKYFGGAPTAEPAGWFNKVVNADKRDVLFRCDNIDGNCDLEGWGGHWRGENATAETVICPLSYTSRWPLAGMCMYGYAVATHEYNSYFASDLLHRLFHMPAIGEGVAEHYADGYREALELAADHPTEAVRNSESLILFALDVYAYEIAVPGEGCTGEPQETDEREEVGVASSSSSSTSVAASATSTAPSECHTHSDGEVHCV